MGYIGKEKDAESSLADHGVRKYDSETGRFTAVDPLSEKYYSLTPYQYAANNPISCIDINGKDIMAFQSEAEIAIKNSVEPQFQNNIYFYNGNMEVFGLEQKQINELIQGREGSNMGKLLFLDQKVKDKIVVRGLDPGSDRDETPQESFFSMMYNPKTKEKSLNLEDRLGGLATGLILISSKYSVSATQNVFPYTLILFEKGYKETNAVNVIHELFIHCFPFYDKSSKMHNRWKDEPYNKSGKDRIDEQKQINNNAGITE